MFAAVAPSLTGLACVLCYLCTVAGAGPNWTHEPGEIRSGDEQMPPPLYSYGKRTEHDFLGHLKMTPSRELLQDSGGSSDEDVECTLNRTQISNLRDATSSTWVIDDDVLESIENDLQTIVNCTQEGDIILFGVSDVIRPPRRINIPRNLTLSTNTSQTDLIAGVFPETTTKTVFRCRRNQGIFLMSTEEVLLANIEFEGCSLNAEGDPAVLEVEQCQSDEILGVIRLHHVAFSDNQLDGASGVFAGTTTCSSVEAIEVRFTDNTCSGICFAHLSSSNDLQDLTIERNTGSGNQVSLHALLYAPPGSTTTAARLNVSENSLPALHVTEGELDLGDSDFTLNSVGSVVFLERATETSITNCSFVQNAAGFLTGAGIFSNSTSSLRILDCTFNQNSALRGGALYSSNGTLELNRCSFGNNNATDFGGAIYLSVSNASFSQWRCFENRAIVNGGCLSLETSSRIAITESAITNNSAEFGGGFHFKSVASVSVTHTVIGGNEARRDGAGGFITEAPRTNIQDCVFFDHEALRSGGGLHCEVESNLTISESGFLRNQARIEGGGIMLKNGCHGSFRNVTWTENIGRDIGGGFRAQNSSVSIRTSVFTRNRARSGGGFMIQTGNAAVEASNLTSNVAERTGGGVSVIRSSITIRNCNFSSNVATRGAGIDFLDGVGDIQNTTMVGNTAFVNRGGGVSGLRCNLTIRNSVFLRNVARNNGGGIDVVLCHVNASEIQVVDNSSPLISGGISIFQETTFNISNSLISGNSGDRGGCIFTRNATFRMDNTTVEFCRAVRGGAMFADDNGTLIMTNSRFLSNTASQHGGAVWCDSGRVMAEDVLFLGNTAGENGGTVHLTKSSRLMLLDSRIRDGWAKTGAGLFMDVGSNAVIQSCVFRNNSATDGGGASDLEDSRAVVNDTYFVGNSGGSGGAFSLQHSSLIALDSIFTDGSASLSGGACFLELSNMTVNSSAFANNNAGSGGALSLQNSTLLMSECSFTNSSASSTGGSVGASTNSNVTAVGVSITGSMARTGGALWLIESSLAASDLEISGAVANSDGGGIYANGSSLLCSTCSFDDNIAEDHGGAVSLFSVNPQSFAFQFDRCDFEGNSAGLGGALHIATRYERRDCTVREANCTFVSLGGCSFVRNRARNAGGAIFAEDPDVVRFTCSGTPRQNPPVAYTRRQLNAMQPLTSSQSPCPSWRRNRAGSYGPTVGSYARMMRSFLVDQETERVIRVTNERHVVENHKGGTQLPSIQLEVLDAFGQGTAIGTGDKFIAATLFSPDGFFDGALSTELDEARKGFPGVNGFRAPGTYQIRVNFSGDGLPSLVIDVQVRECINGEAFEPNSTLCIPCSSSQFNLSPQNTECQPCPDDGICTTPNVILPKRGFWHRTPCSQHIEECLLQGACDFGQREAELLRLTADMTSCDLNETLIEDYGQSQCQKGYTDILCGSCTKDYGRSQTFRCRECLPRGINILLFISYLFLLLFLSSLGIKSSLISKAKNNRISRTMYPVSRSIRSYRSVAINFQMVEMMHTGYVPPEMLQSTPTRPSPTESQKKEKAEMTKRKITEIFKITINFLQVTAVAIYINANWTEFMLSLFSVADFFGGAATEGVTLSIDCLFSSRLNVTRTVVRLVMLYLIPLLIVVLFVVFWAFQKIRLAESWEYFAKRSLLSCLVVFYVTYVSVTKTAVNTLYCISVYDSVDLESDSRTRYWALDTSFKCYEGPHAILASVLGWPVVFAFSIGFPVLIARLLVKMRTRQITLTGWVAESTGFLYRAYKEKYIYWESVILLRKAVLAVIVVFGYALGSNIQGILAVCVLMLASYVHVLCHPFKEEFESLNQYEGVSLIVSQLTFASGLFFDDDRTPEGVRIVLTILLSMIIAGLFLFFTFSFLKTAALYLKFVIEESDMEVPSDWSTFHILRVYVVLSLARFLPGLCGSAIQQSRHDLPTETEHNTIPNR